MRRFLSVFSLLLLLLGLLPAASAAPKAIDYKPIEVGDTFRNEVPSLEAIANLEEVKAGTTEAGTSQGAATAEAPVVGTEKYFVFRNGNGWALTLFVLRGVGEHGEVWVQKNLDFPAGDPRNPVIVTDDQVAYLINEFDNNMYPKESAFWTEPDMHTGEHSSLAGAVFGDPNYYVSPDGANRVVILVSNVRDENYHDPTYPNYIAGFYASVFETYIDRNVMTIDAYDWGNRVGPDTSPWRPADGTANDRPYLYEGTFAHEYQHLLHDDIDSDEENWINEGMSDFAEYLTGYSHLNTDGHITSFMKRPYNSLVNWEDRGGLEVLSDYGAAYLMQLYLHQNYGPEFIKALAYNQANGIAGVDSTLSQMQIPRTFEEIYRDWATAILVNGKTAAPKYSFEGLDLSVVLDDAGDSGPDALPWGPNFIRIPARPKITNVMIEGISFLPTPWSVVADPMDGGNQALYSGSADLADNMLILPVDLTGQTGSSLSFKSLYDIEEHWDFGMVQVSTDGGATWSSLANAQTSSDHDPSAHPDIIANLPGLSGYSDGWIDLSYDLSAYDGQQVLVAFRYMTDWGSLGNGALEAPGWYIDDIAVGGFTSDGSSLDGFQSIEQVTDRFAEYMITFVGKMKAGKAEWQVLQLDMQTFDEATQMELKKFISNAALDEVIVIVSYAAPQGTQSTVPFSVEVERRNEVQSNKQ